MTAEIRIWVGNLGKYNEGELVGEWFTLPHDIDDIMKRIGVASGTRYEEYEIFDWEAPSFVEVHRCSSIKHLNEIAEALQELDEQEIQVLEIGLEEGVFNRNDLVYAIDEVIRGACHQVLTGYSELGDFAIEHATENGQIDAENDSLMKAVDWNWYAKELGFHTTHFQINDNTWVEFFD